MAEAPRSPVGNTVTMDVVDLHSSSINNTVAIDAIAIGEGGAALPVNLQCPAIPQLNLKLPDLSSSSSESDEDQLTPAITLAVASIGGPHVGRPTSPPPNCAICLGRCKNKCFTDSCMHQFCFKCLCEWSKVKPECPLCKQTFKSIIHNVKSIDQFEEYHVQPPAVQIPHPLEVTYRQSPYILDVLNPQLEVSLQGLRAVRTVLYPSSLSTAGGAAATNGNNPGNIQNQFIHRGELLDMYRQEFPDAIASSGTLSQLWRRYVFDRKLYALPLCDITGRFRESSARFYRDNPAQIHRLMPWINRDIVCLLRNTEHDVSFVLERINEWLTMINILSPLFRRRLQPILGTKTAHFIHELNNFARSPFDMIGYDRAVQYSPQNTEEVVIEFSSSSSSADSSDEEPVNVVDADIDSAAGSNVAIAGSEANSGGSAVPERRRPSHRSRNATQTSTSTTTASRSREYRVQSRAPMVNLLSFTISTTSEGVEAPGVTVAVNGRGSQSAAINLTTHNRAPSDVIIDLDDPDVDTSPNIYNNYTTGGDGGNSSTTSADAAPSSTTNSERAMPSLIPATSLQRATPTVTANIELSSTSSDECEFVLERKPPHLRTPEMVSLNSESDSDVVFVDESRFAFDRYSTTSEDEATKAKPATSNAKQQRTLNQEVKQSADGSDYEYNVGASTSTGLRSSGRRGRRQKLINNINKLKKRTLRSSKDSLEKSKRKRSNTAATLAHKAIPSSFASTKSSEMSLSTSSESAEDNVRLAADQKCKRLKRKAGENRVTRSAIERTKEKTKDSGRSTKRKYSEEYSNGDRKLSKRMHFNEEKHKNKTAEHTDDSDFSSTEDACLSVLRKRLIAMQNQETGEPEEQQNAIEQQQEADERNTVVTAAANEQAVDRSQVNNDSLISQVKREEYNSEEGELCPQYNEVVTTVNDEDNANNCTASNNYSCFNTIDNENEPTTSSTVIAETTTVSSSLPTEPMFANVQQQQQQHVDDTTFSSITQTTVKTRSNSRTSCSSYTTTTTTATATTDSTSSTQSSSSSSSSDDSDSDDGRKRAKKNAKTTYNISSSNKTTTTTDDYDCNVHAHASGCTGTDNLNFDPLIGANAPHYYFNTNATSPSNDTQEAATNEAAVALADFANSSFRLQLGNADPELILDMPIFSSDSEDNNIADEHNIDDDDDM